MSEINLSNNSIYDNVKKKVTFNPDIKVVTQQHNKQPPSCLELDNFWSPLPLTCSLCNNCESYDNSSQEYQDPELKCSKTGVVCFPVDFTIYFLGMICISCCNKCKDCMEL